MTKRKQTTIKTHINCESTASETFASDSLTLTFSNGKTLILALENLTPHQLAMAALHGLKQKLCDAAAVTCDPETGRPADVEVKYKLVESVFNRLVEGGPWNAVRTGEGAASGGLLLQALERLYPNKPKETVREYFDGLTDKQKTQLRTKNPKIVAAINAIQAERGSAAIGDELLEGLEGLED